MQDRPPLPSSNSTWNPEAACVSFLFFLPLLSHLKEVGGSSKVSLSEFLLSDSSCDTHVEMLRNATLRKPKGQATALVPFAGGGTNPQAGGEDLVRLTFWRPPDPPAHKSCCLSQKRPATQVSSCCNKLLLTQDYGSFQIPPREQGNKHSLPGLSPSCFSCW